MDNNLKSEIEQLKGYDSEEAAQWLIDTYPFDSEEYWKAISLISHRSWKKGDQLKLARHYFKKVPFSSAKPYEAFASFMSLSNLIKVVREYVPSDSSDLDLLIYHLEPVLRKMVAKMGSGESELEEFITGIK